MLWVFSFNVICNDYKQAQLCKINMNLLAYNTQTCYIYITIKTSSYENYKRNERRDNKHSNRSY